MPTVPSRLLVPGTPHPARGEEGKAGFFYLISCAVTIHRPQFLLQGLYYIAQGLDNKAKQLFEDILKAQPYNDIIPKQMVRSGGWA